MLVRFAEPGEGGFRQGRRLRWVAHGGVDLVARAGEGQRRFQPDSFTGSSNQDRSIFPRSVFLIGEEVRPGRIKASLHESVVLLFSWASAKVAT